MSPSRLRVKKDGAWTWISLKGLAKRIRLGDADGCSRLVEGCVDSILVQLEDPLAYAALEDEPEEDQKEAADSPKPWRVKASHLAPKPWRWASCQTKRSIEPWMPRVGPG